MAFSSTGLTSIVTNGLDGGPSMWLYASSDSSTDIAYTSSNSTDQTGLGYLRGVGYGGRAAGTIGLRVGDLVALVASSAAVIPGELVWLSVIRSSADQLTTSGTPTWGASYNVTLGGWGVSTLAST